MISSRSALTFVYINLLLSGSSFLMHHVMTFYHAFWIKSMFMFAKNATFVFGLDFLADYRNKIQDSAFVTNVSPVTFESMAYLVTASVMETVSYVSIAAFFRMDQMDDKEKDNAFSAFLLFIPLSFAVEIVFDFFHYWSHRILHTFSWLYLFHKKHHSIHSLTGIVTFYQDPVDYLLTNVLPMIFSMSIVQYVFQIKYTMLLYSFLVMYKEFIEIAGHVDILNSRSFSFPQFIWLPLFFGMEMTQKVHHDHHLYLTCNYAKRFSLWDKVFGTFRQ